MSTKIVIVIYSLYGHITALAEEIQKGLEAAGCETMLCRSPELLSDEILEEMDAPLQDDTIPICQVKDLAEADGILFGISARFGIASAQLKSLWDSTGQLWVAGALAGKPAGIFVSTGTQGGGQETSPLSWVTQLTHHGLIFVPNGYTDPSLFNMDEIRGGTPYGTGTFAGFEGDRELSELEVKMAQNQGNKFATIAKSLKMGREIMKSQPVDLVETIVPEVIVPLVEKQEFEHQTEETSLEKEESHEIEAEEKEEHEENEEFSTEDIGLEIQQKEIMNPQHEPLATTTEEEINDPVKDANETTDHKQEIHHPNDADDTTATNTSEKCCLVM
mmetsp:Transcript_19657/g.27687  ORF Transcript_19657/g.27687 Transcript_19657/m.27687 type:complete len:332 (-) Transcript_19657:98-1093(-)